MTETRTDTICNTDIYRSAMKQAHETHKLWLWQLWTSNVFIRGCESPLEGVWRVWWSLATLHHHDKPCARYQHEVEADGRTYRLDVALFHRDGRPILAVELDGHTHHERTPAQVAERNARDRALQAAGWTVLHFSYHEMVDRGLECAVEALERFERLSAATVERIA